MIKGLTLGACVLVMLGLLHTARSSRRAAQAADNLKKDARQYVNRVQDAIDQTEREWGGSSRGDHRRAPRASR